MTNAFIVLSLLGVWAIVLLVYKIVSDKKQKMAH
jgi:hypothetical protein